MFRHPFTRFGSPAAVRRSRAPAACYPAFSGLRGQGLSPSTRGGPERSGEDVPLRLLQPTRKGTCTQPNRSTLEVRVLACAGAARPSETNPRRATRVVRRLTTPRELRSSSFTSPSHRPFGWVRRTRAKTHPSGPRSRVPGSAPPSMRRCLPRAGRAHFL